MTEEPNVGVEVDFDDIRAGDLVTIKHTVLGRKTVVRYHTGYALKKLHPKYGHGWVLDMNDPCRVAVAYRDNVVRASRATPSTEHDVSATQ